MVVNGLTVFQHSGYGLDKRDEFFKVIPEFRDIKDIEEDVVLCLLWETAPA